MYRLFGIPTQNTLKVAFVLEEMGLKYEYKQVDLAKGEQKTESFLKVNPIGKVPALQHNDFSVAESGAICRYLANTPDSTLYPNDREQRASIDMWMDFFSCHLGRWLSTLYFEKVLRTKMNFGTTNLDKVEEALGFLPDQFMAVDARLSTHTFLAGDSLSIADLSAFAYINQAEAIGYDLTTFKNVSTWYDKLKKLPSVTAAQAKIHF